MSHTSIQSLIQQHENLKDLLEKYPSQASSVCQTLLDVTYASNWTNLRLIDMKDFRSITKDEKADEEEKDLALSNILICGLKPESKGLESIWTCSITDILQTEKFQQVFTCLDNLSFNATDKEGKQIPILKDHFLLAVHAQDGTVVYYNLARGLVKPIN